MGAAKVEMNPEYVEAAGRTLRDRGIECASGLTASEFETAEAEHGFRFPPDLRFFLSQVLPVGKGFPNWRSRDSRSIRDRLAWPAESLRFDVEHNGFWLPEWGPKPDSLDEAGEKARDHVRAAPFLIPIYHHRYLPASPCESGNPVYSVHQTDIVVYGLDLPSYLFAEFGIPNPFRVPDVPREIEFWSKLASS